MNKIRRRLTVDNYRSITERFIRDRTALQELMPKIDDLLLSLLLAQNKEDILGFHTRMDPYLAMPDSWKGFKDEYEELKPMLDRVRESKKALKERKEMLGMSGVELPHHEALYPTLWGICQRLGVDIFNDPAYMIKSKKASLAKNVRSQEAAGVGSREAPPLSHLEETVVGPKTSLGRFMAETRAKRGVRHNAAQNELSPIAAVIDAPEPGIIRGPDVERGGHPYALFDRYRRGTGLVGERELSVITLLGLIHKCKFGIESPSGSGKSIVAKKVMPLFPDGAIYKAGLASATALSRDADEINKARTLYMSELQKVMGTKNPIVIEGLKDICEGETWQRLVTEKLDEKPKKYEVATMGVFFTLAIENDFKYDWEFSRRVFTLTTDHSLKQTDAIIKSKAARRHVIVRDREAMDPSEEAELRDHVANCTHLDDLLYENPMSDIIAESIPRVTRARSFDDYLDQIIQAAARFSYQDRMVAKVSLQGEEKECLFIEVADVYAADIAFYESFMSSLLGLPVYGRQILGMMDSDLNTANEVYESLRALNPSISKRLVQTIFDRMEGFNLIEKEGIGRNPIYRKTVDLSVFDFKRDYRNLFQEGFRFLTANYGSEIADTWAAKQILDGQVIGYNPLDGEVVELAEAQIPVATG